MWHPQGLLLGVSPGGDVIVRDAETFCTGVVARGASGTNEFTQWDRILSLSMVNATMAAAKVQIALPPAPGSPTPTTEPTLYTDFLVFLRDPAIGILHFIIVVVLPQKSHKPWRCFARTGAREGVPVISLGDGLLGKGGGGGCTPQFTAILPPFFSAGSIRNFHFSLQENSFVPFTVTRHTVSVLCRRCFGCGGCTKKLYVFSETPRNEQSMQKPPRTSSTHAETILDCLQRPQFYRNFTAVYRHLSQFFQGWRDRNLPRPQTLCVRGGIVLYKQVPAGTAQMPARTTQNLARTPAHLFRQIGRGTVCRVSWPSRHIPPWHAPKHALHT